MVSIKKVAALITTDLITGIVYLGVYSGKDNCFVVWFGIASATTAPVAGNLGEQSAMPLFADVTLRGSGWNE